MVNICAVSDLHGKLVDIPKCDILCIAGDVTPYWDHSIPFQMKWLNTDFRYWLERVPAVHIIGIAGNHDIIFDSFPELVPTYLNWHYLQDSSIEICGLKFYGSPWTTSINYNFKFHCTEEKLALYWSNIPSDTDILITHSPPYGIGDKTPRLINDPDNDTQWPIYEHVGSPSLLSAIQKIQPKVGFFGHIHGNYGNFLIGSSRIYNVALLNNGYQLAYPPLVIEV